MSEIIQIGKHAYHIGLTWRSFEERINSAELRDIAAEINQCDGAYWMTDGARYIWGFATSLESGKRYTRCVGKKCSLLALELASRADVLPFAFVLRNQNKYSFVVVDGNRIPLPGSDVWYDDDAKMQEALSPYAEIFADSMDVARVLRLAVVEHPDGVRQKNTAPEESGDIWVSLSDYLDNKQTEVAIGALHYVSLSPRSFKSAGYAVGFAAAIGLVAYAGYQWYADHEAPIKNAASTITTTWHPPVAAPKMVAKPRPAETVSAAFFLDSCHKLYTLPFVMHGYTLHSATCHYSTKDKTITLRGDYQIANGGHPPVLQFPKKTQNWKVSPAASGLTLTLSQQMTVPDAQIMHSKPVQWQTLARRTWGSHDMVSVVPGVIAGSGTLQSEIGISPFADILMRASHVAINDLTWNGQVWRVKFNGSPDRHVATPVQRGFIGSAQAAVQNMRTTFATPPVQPLNHPDPGFTPGGTGGVTP